MPRVILFMLILLTSLVPAAAAQDDAGPLPSNSRIRMSVSTSELIRVLSGAPLTKKQLRRDQFLGTLQGRRGDDVVIRLEYSETELAIPVKSVERLEISHGMRACTVEGASIGVVAGFGGGFALGLIACSSGDCESETMVVATAIGAIGALAGGAIGAITGSQLRCEHWRTVKIKDLPYGEGLPVENGIRVGFTIPPRSRDLVAGTEGY